MSARQARRARVSALAKVNLELRVLGKRADGYHELRSIFQTVSLADSIDLAFTPGASGIEIDDAPHIPNNLAVRAARLAMEETGTSGRLEIRLKKQIPMGAGLGGGSSDAAAVLLALPALMGARLGLEELSRLAGQLGSDVPFFLLGGAAAAIGRGTELFPLPDYPSLDILIVHPGVHVDTPGAYQALSPRLTCESEQNKIFSFQSRTWNPTAGVPAVNDFEMVVFERHGRLAEIKQELLRAGASAAMMTGSGSAVFGLFAGREQAARGLRNLTLGGEEKAFHARLVSRARYRSLWRRSLAEHIVPDTWPPQSRHSK
jgi:4-diphosphocytidyl-2-C-methyl-D-erythritol kinase